MNEDLRKILELLTAMNARLEMNERLTQQIDQQLALLNIKREAELAELRSSLGISTRESDLLTIRMTLQNLGVAIDKLGEKIDAKISGAEIVRAVEDLRQNFRAEDLQAIQATLQNLTGAVEKLSAGAEIARAVEDLRQNFRAEDLQAIQATLQNLTSAVEKLSAGAEIARAVEDLRQNFRAEDLQAIQATLQNLTGAVEKLGAVSEIAKYVEDLRQNFRAEDLQAIQATLQNLTGAVEKLGAVSEIAKSVEDLRIAAKNTVKADDFLIIKMALQNSSIAINDVKKRVDGLKFDTTKRFNELSVNSEINHKAVLKAIADLLEDDSDKPKVDPRAENFKVCSWWSGDKES